MKILQGIYDNLIDFYTKSPDGHSKADKVEAPTPTAPAAAPKSSGWSWFKRRSAKPQPVQSQPEEEVKHTGTNYNIIHNTSAPTAVQTFAVPKGLYLWGGPGCGKTYLMDLLFNSIQNADIKKARVDFHSFMLEINMKLHQMRQKYGETCSLGSPQVPAATRCPRSRATSPRVTTCCSSTSSK